MNDVSWRTVLVTSFNMLLLTFGMSRKCYNYMCLQGVSEPVTVYSHVTLDLYIYILWALLFTVALTAVVMNVDYVDFSIDFLQTGSL